MKTNGRHLKSLINACYMNVLDDYSTLKTGPYFTVLVITMRSLLSLSLLSQPCDLFWPKYVLKVTF